MGKKVAQSEAGKSAGRAAIKGAGDAAAKDLSNRYFGEETGPTTTVTAPVKNLKPSNTTNYSTSHVSSQKCATTTDSDDEYERIVQESSYESTRQFRQKPSVFARFKPNISLKGSKPEPRRVAKKQSEKVYKYVLSKEADWENLPQAITLHNYRAEMKCDLEFRKGQIIQIMTRSDSQNDWWEGRIEDRVGIFPANYVKML